MDFENDPIAESLKAHVFHTKDIAELNRLFQCKELEKTSKALEELLREAKYVTPSGRSWVTIHTTDLERIADQFQLLLFGNLARLATEAELDAATADDDEDYDCDE